MSEYLSKEEIKQWRSSLEKITLEEFAARLGKKVEEKKETNDLVDIFLHGKPVISDEGSWNAPRIERLSSIADKAYEREKELYVSPFSAQVLKEEITKKPDNDTINSTSENTEISDKKSAKSKSKTTASKSEKSSSKKSALDVPTGDKLRDEVRIVFKKALTDREQKVFDYFSSHKNKIVYAKDLAQLLDLPRDYVYKYIKNLRAKIDGEALKNADKGGFILSV